MGVTICVVTLVERLHPDQRHTTPFARLLLHQVWLAASRGGSPAHLK